MDDPASIDALPALRTGATRPAWVFDSVSHSVGLLACLAAAAASALLGLPAALTAACAFMGAVTIVVVGARSRPAVGSVRNATVIADEILAAGDLVGVESAVRAEIESWPEFDLRWCALAPIVSLDDQRRLPHSVARELQLVLTAVDLSDPAPTLTSLPDGEAVALTCGSESNLVLVVKASSIPDDAASVFGGLAALAGVAARQIDLERELGSQRRSVRYEELVRFSSDAIFIVDASGTIRYAAPSVTAVLGRLSADVEGTALRSLVVDEQQADIDTFLGNVQLLGARNPTSVALRFLRNDGVEIDGELTGANLLDNADVRGMVVTIRDVSGRIELERQLRHQAFHDGLTGLANRALFRDRLDRAIRVRRDATDHAPAVAYIDVDDFKAVNDSFGHAAGDQVLRAVAERINACLRGGDTAARLGGDEFAILVEDIPDDDALVLLVQRVVDAIAAPMTVGRDTIVTVSASAGLATCAGDVSSSDDLLRRADMAMYRAKLRGKQQVAHYESGMQDVVHERMEIAADLDRAIRSGEIGVHYQPVIDLVSERIVGVEVFVRWERSERGVVEPHDFLEVAEETGLIVPMGALVLDRALRDLREWQDLGVDGFDLSVNVSARQFLHDDFESMVLGTMAIHGIDPERLQLEITEGVLTAGGARAEERLRRLVAHGVSVALDDFGTGQSSLRTLQALPVGQLKIDRSFVSTLDTDGRTITRSIVDLAVSLGASAVAEGIERPDELAALRDLGCGFGQGNLFAAPGPAATVLPLLLTDRLVPAPASPA